MGETFYTITKSILITNALEIDSRYIRDTISERDAVAVSGVAHEGLLVYVKDTLGTPLTPVGKLYILKDIASNTWEEVGGSGGDLSYEYTDHEVTAADTWIINNHGLDKKPSITIVGADNLEVEASVEYVSNTEVKIYFNAPFAGKAFLN